MQSVRVRRALRAAQWLFPVLLLVLARPVSPAPAPRVFTDPDKGATVQLQAGDLIEIHLQCNPTTGYYWYLLPQSTRLMKLTGQSQTEPDQPGVGRPVVQIFKFQAVGRGDGVVLLHYVRSWEPPSPTDQQFDLHVSIR